MSMEKKGNPDNTFTYKNATLQIENRSVSSEDYVMQISSISQARIGKLPKKKPSLLVILTILGLACLFFFLSGSYYNDLRDVFTYIGYILLAILVIYFIGISQEVQQYGLSIELNSGRINCTP